MSRLRSAPDSTTGPADGDVSRAAQHVQPGAEPRRLTPEELAAIRERDAAITNPGMVNITAERVMALVADRRALLAHIDAITEAKPLVDITGLDPILRALADEVESLPGDFQGDGHGGGRTLIDRAAVLDLLRGIPKR